MSEADPAPIEGAADPQDRRTFLKRSGAVVSAAAFGTGPVSNAGAEGPAQSPALDPAVLRAVASHVLPGELDPDSREGAVLAFEAWAAEYEPVAELNHGYGTSTIRYGPPDPVPGWNAQLSALDLEARRRHESGFADLGPSDAWALLERHVGDDGPQLPDPLRARHVAVALMAHWFGTPEASDRCYGRAISPRTCRGLDRSAAEPEALP